MSCSTRRPCGSRSAPRTRDSRSRCSPAARSTVVDAAVAAGVRKVVAASSASVYGTAEQFPTGERHHPYNDDTAYGVAKTFGEGVLRSFRAAHGPRLRGAPLLQRVRAADGRPRRLHRGARPLARPDRGKAPPDRPGDGSAPMDFVYVEDVARANVLAASRPGTRCTTSPAASRRRCSSSRAVVAVTGSTWPSNRPAAEGNPCPGATRRRRPRATELGFDAHDRARRRAALPRRLVASDADGAGLTTPIRETSRSPARCSDEAEAAAARQAILSGWVTQGPEVAAFEEEFAARRWAPPRLRGVELHDRPAPGPARPRRRARRRGGDGQPLVHRHGQRDPVLRRQPVFVDVDPDVQHGPGPDRGGHHPRTKAILPVHQIGLPCDLAAIREIADRHGLPVVEDAACAIGSEVHVDDHWERDRRPARGRRLLLLPPAQDHHDRRRRDADDARRRARPALPLLRQHAMSVPDTVRHARRRPPRSTPRSVSTTA